MVSKRVHVTLVGILIVGQALLAVAVMTTAETVVLTRLGRIRGTQETSQPNGRPFFAFRGIPYAKPPVAELRWQDPVAYGSWTVPLLDATNYAAMCPQFDSKTRTVIGDEDCLYLNVFTPRVPGQGAFIPRDQRQINEVDVSTKPDIEPRQFQGFSTLPVMVWFHGGGFIQGASQFYGPEFLLREDVVLVTVNYRLGALGFLSSGDKTLPGNYGMLDQVEALRWVRENIADFGGNPNQVTIFGESAGGASTHLLSLSPLTAGLFHNVIFQSGSATCNWSVENEPLDYAIQLATRVNCTSRDSQSFVACLRTKTTQQLVQATKDLQKYSLFPLRTAPVVDRTTRANPFLPDTPKNLIKNKQFKPVPMMSGILENEGLLFTAWILMENLGKISSPSFLENELFPNVISSMLKNQTKFGAAVDAIKQQYMAGVSFSDFGTFFSQFTQILDDALFTSCVYEAQMMHAEYAPVYAYVFSYRGELTPSYGAKFFDFLRRSGVDHPLMQNGVSHADELLYLFRTAGTNASYSATDMQISMLMTRLWANFASTGMPMPSTVTSEGYPFWSPIPSNTKDVSYFTISAAPRLSSSFRKAECNFWTEVVPYVRNLAVTMSLESESYLTTTWALLILFLISLVVIAALVSFIIYSARSRRYPDRGVTLQRSN